MCRIGLLCKLYQSVANLGIIFCLCKSLQHFFACFFVGGREFCGKLGRGLVVWGFFANFAENFCTVRLALLAEVGGSACRR